MADETTATVPAADNTATAGEQDQSLLSPPVAPDTGSPEDSASAAETPKGEDDAPLLSPEGDKKDDPVGAPEQYADFTLPEGFSLDGEDREAATTLFKDLDLPQDKAQKLVDYYTQRLQGQRAAEMNALAESRRAWRSEVRQRPDFAAERALAMKGMQMVVTEADEKELFKDSWLSDHPALFKVFAKVGRLIGEDSFPKGDGQSPPDNLNLHRFPVQ